MDLLSCPQEMLASVLKYTPFVTVTRIRKTNKHMDYVAVKYRMNLLRLRKITLLNYGRSQAQLFIEYSMRYIWESKHDDLMSFYKSSIHDQHTILSAFEDFSKKIHSTRLVAFHDCDIDQNIIDYLQKSRMSKNCSLYINNCNFAVSLEKLTNVFSKYRKSDIIMQSSNKIMNETMGTEVVMISLLPYSSICLDMWSLAIDGPAITDETLRVARKHLPHAFQVPYHACFSLKEIKKTMFYLIDCYEHGVRRLTRWQLGSVQLNSREEIEQTCQELIANIPRISIYRYNPDRAFITYRPHKVYRTLFEVSLKLR